MHGSHTHPTWYVFFGSIILMPSFASNAAYLVGISGSKLLSCWNPVVNITVETRAFIPAVTLLLPVVGSTGDTLFI
jgi:hypothetical protein